MTSTMIRPPISSTDPRILLGCRGQPVTTPRRTPHAVRRQVLVDQAALTGRAAHSVAGRLARPVVRYVERARRPAARALLQSTHAAVRAAVGAAHGATVRHAVTSTAATTSSPAARWRAHATGTTAADRASFAGAAVHACAGF